MSTSATNSVSVTADLPDAASESVTFTLLSTIVSGAEIIDRSEQYTMALDGSGQGSVSLPTPDATGDAASLWSAALPNGSVVNFSLSYSGGAQTLASLIAAGLAVAEASAVSALLSGYMQASVYDAAGIAEQLVGLTSTQTLTGKTLVSFTNNIDADDLHAQFRNESGVTLTAGTPVYASGYNLGQDLVEVGRADSSSASTMPCIGIVKEDVDTNATGTAIVAGVLEDVDTSAFSVGDVLYVSETAGALTATAPASGALAQKVAVVVRSHAVNGVLLVQAGVDDSSLQRTGGSMSGELEMLDNLLSRPKLLDYSEAVNAIGSIGGGTQDIDLELGNVVTATVDTSTTTFTFSNPPASGSAGSFTLILTNGGSQTVNWPGTVSWAGGTAPSLTAAGLDVLTFLTTDAGATWLGFASGLDMQ